MPSPLTREIDAVQNAALGAVVLWRFASAYGLTRKSPESTPLPMLFLPLPLVLYEETLSVIGSTHKASTLRTFATKFSDLKHKDADLLRSLNSRAIAYRQLTLESLRLAVACRLLHIDGLTSEVLALSKTETQQSTLSGVTPLLGAADKLGVWCGGLTTFEVATALHVSV